jgi:hypothetical protein
MAVSFATDIRPLFTQTDIDHMAFFCDLSSYDDVKTNAQDILNRLQAIGGPLMPPTNSGGPWPKKNVDLFQKWINDGFQP